MKHEQDQGDLIRWINKCDEVVNIESYLSKLTEYEREIFWHHLANEIQQMETERIFRKHFALTACDPKQRVDLEKESFRTEFQIQCESVFERWKAYKNRKSLNIKKASDGGAKKRGIGKQRFLRIG
jgi:hypothetical protein